MTTEEKLKQFTELCITDSRKRADKIIKDYKQALENSFEEHKANELRRADMQVKFESDKIHKEMNKTRSLEQIKLKKLIGDKKKEIDDKIFTALENKIEQFMETPAYYNLLDKQIKAAIAFAGADKLDIYIDPHDKKLMQRLSIENNIDLIESKYSFMGGTRAVIPEKNILMDNSFEKKLSDAKLDFHLHYADIGGLNNNE